MKLRALVIVLTTTTLSSLVHAHGSDDEHATIIDGDATYTELHMAQEHHMDSFDIQSFFHLHDLNRDGILDVNELESIYGVHHEKAKKGSASIEIHTEKAKEIVQQVLAKLDQDGDGYLTLREFVAGGVGGLPNFKGVEHLGHHYGQSIQMLRPFLNCVCCFGGEADLNIEVLLPDAEGEYFLHHEEKYHSTPETQGEESYIHPEDIEHFMAHEKIEKEEAEREREFQGLPLEDSSSKSESIHDPNHQDVNQDILMDNFEIEKAQERLKLLAMAAGEDVANAADILRAGAATGASAGVPPGQIPIVAPRRKKTNQATTEGDQVDRSAGNPPPVGTELSAEEKKRQERAEFARQQAAKFGKDVREASRRGEWGSDGDSFKRPRDPADRLRKNVPYKFKIKKSFWGEF